MAAGQNAAMREAHTAKDGEFQRNHPAKGVSRVIDADRGMIELLMPDGETPRKKFALVGFASSTRGFAPYNDPEWAIAGMNQLSRHIPRADWWFEMHREWNTAVVPGTDHEGWLAQCEIPVMMTSRVSSIPTSVRFPIDTLTSRVADYFTSTVAYMVAYTTWHIDRLVEMQLRETPPNGLATAWDVVELARSLYADYTIGIFGIDLIVGEEYDWQKACAEFHIGVALSRNIRVVIPPQSALCHQRYRYGYEMEPNDLVKDSDIEKRMAYLRTEHQKHLEAAMQLSGAIGEMSYLKEFRTLRERGGQIG